jgi:hypothetical protein
MLNPEIAAELEEMQPMGLQMLESVALQNRTDTKYLLSEGEAATILRACAPHFRVLEIEGRRGSFYSTQYFDTPDLAMYLDHHNGVRDRYKVRLRSYRESGGAWLEIKRKTNLERTVKSRLSLSEVDPELGVDAVGYFTAEEAYFIRESTPYDPLDLYPVVNNEFTRITLASVDTNRPERITIDAGLHVRWRNETMRLPGVVIAEVKRPRAGANSVFSNAASAVRVQPTPFSKYCITIALLAPNVRMNLFKETIRKLERLLADNRPAANATPDRQNGREPAR